MRGKKDAATYWHSRSNEVHASGFVHHVAFSDSRRRQQQLVPTEFGLLEMSWQGHGYENPLIGDPALPRRASCLCNFFMKIDSLRCD